MANKRRRFSQEFKDEVVRLVVDGGQSCSDVARQHELAPSQLAQWVRQARVDAGDSPGAALTSNERREMTQLRRQLRESHREIAFLKKCAVFLGQQPR